MARYELLNNLAHQDLRVDMRFGAGLGEPAGLALAFPTEFAELQREYPIFLRKDADSDRYQAVAVLGFEAGENLFIQGQRWNAGYLPGIVAKGPFLIGFQEQRIDGALVNEPVIHVDLDHPRLQTKQGERVFLPQGGQSNYLKHVITILRGIHDGSEGGTEMFRALDAAGLIQPTQLALKLDQEHGVSLAGLYGIDRERLAALDAATLHGLHRAGYLEGAFLMLSSLHNVRRLMAEKQRRLREAQAAPAPTTHVA